MVDRQRVLARRRLDEEMRSYRKAGLRKDPTNGLLRAVRRALGLPAAAIAEKMGVRESVVFRFEATEQTGSIKMSSMARAAEAMGCKLVYGIVPEGGKTLEWLVEKRLWEDILGKRKGNGQGSGTKGIGNKE